MSTPGPSTETPTPSGSTPNRGKASRGSHKPRGGLGKYLRARGRGGGRARGRPAEFRQRLVLEDEEEIEIDPESEEFKELQQKYSKRQLGSNADRYKEPEPVLNSDGEVEEEPEVDLSAFLERQKLEDVSTIDALEYPAHHGSDDDDIDASLASFSYASAQTNTRKGKVQTMEWNKELESMSREKAAADAQRDMKARFKAKIEKQVSTSEQKTGLGRKHAERVYVEAPPLPVEIGGPPPPVKSDKEDMEDFLDDLLG